MDEQQFTILRDLILTVDRNAEKRNAAMAASLGAAVASHETRLNKMGEELDDFRTDTAERSPSSVSRGFRSAIQAPIEGRILG
ncbi:MAG TPA: hypothetical protein VHY34_12275 [Caulobacteraceae bacterium]|nr:hypothetical protein [Caulobacteraceae bacterium]